MLNTKKFLYILPDTAYIAEVLPAKKPHTFAIQAFRQINGAFLDDNEFIAANMEKLFAKIDPEEYQLVLPDFLFTNTIVDVNETDEKAVKKYLVESLLPSLNLNKETHEIETFVLTQRQGKSKVQISALEKSLLAPIQKAVEAHKVTISSISPLSWTIKSIVSLEPSITAIQIGSKLYVALHYIGVDQTISFDIVEAGNVIETIKTLKGAEPSIQTLYLLTNALVENDIKEKLSGTLPVQQLSNFSDEQEGIPSYMKQIVQSVAKTFDIPEFPVPKFPIGEYTGSLSDTPAAASAEPEEEKEDMDTNLPTPTPPAPKAQVTPVVPPAPTVTPAPAPTVMPASEPPKITPIVPAAPIAPASTPVTMPVSPAIIQPPVAATPVKPEIKPVMPTVKPAAPISVANVVPYVQSQPMQTPLQPAQSSMPSTSMPVAPAPSAPQTVSPQRPVLKNKSSGKSMAKVILVTLLALIITVAAGIAIGFAVLTLTDKKHSATHTPVADTSASPVPSPVPSPTLAPTPSPVATALDPKKKSSWKILIVNATKIAGKAGKVKSSLTAAGYTSVATGNAQGTYSQPGYFVLMSQNDATVISVLQKDSGLSLSYADGKSSEDPNNTYDAVIVLNK